MRQELHRSIDIAIREGEETYAIRLEVGPTGTIAITMSTATAPDERARPFMTVLFELLADVSSVTWGLSLPP